MYARTQVWLAVMLNLAAMCALTSVIITSLLNISRLMFAMAADGLLPAGVGEVDADSKTPHVCACVCFCVFVCLSV